MNKSFLKLRMQFKNTVEAVRYEFPQQVGDNCGHLNSEALFALLVLESLII